MSKWSILIEVDDVESIADFEDRFYFEDEVQINREFVKAVVKVEECGG